MTPTLAPTNIQEHIGNVKITLDHTAVLLQYNIGIKEPNELIWNNSYADCVSANKTRFFIDFKRLICTMDVWGICASTALALALALAVVFVSKNLVFELMLPTVS